MGFLQEPNCKRPPAINSRINKTSQAAHSADAARATRPAVAAAPHRREAGAVPPRWGAPCSMADSMRAPSFIGGTDRLKTQGENSQARVYGPACNPAARKR